MQTWGCWVISLAPVPAIDPHCCCGHGALVELLSATVSRVVPADLAHAPIHSIGRRGQLFEASSLPDAELLYVLVELREVSVRTFLQPAQVFLDSSPGYQHPTQLVVYPSRM